MDVISTVLHHRTHTLVSHMEGGRGEGARVRKEKTVGKDGTVAKLAYIRVSQKVSYLQPLTARPVL